MNPLRVVLILALAASVCGFAPAPKPKPKKVADLAALAGSWRVVRYHQGARNMLENRTLFMKVEKDRMTFQQFQEQGGTSSAWGISVDTKPTPPTMNWHQGKDNAVAYVAIYTLERDTLSIVFTNARGAGGDNGRPKSFTELRPEEYLMVLKREPKAVGGPVP